MTIIGAPVGTLVYVITSGSIGTGNESLVTVTIETSVSVLTVCVVGTHVIVTLVYVVTVESITYETFLKHGNSKITWLPHRMVMQ